MRQEKEREAKRKKALQEKLSGGVGGHGKVKLASMSYNLAAAGQCSGNRDQLEHRHSLHVVSAGLSMAVPGTRKSVCAGSTDRLAGVVL